MQRVVTAPFRQQGAAYLVSHVLLIGAGVLGPNQRDADMSYVLPGHFRVGKEYAQTLWEHPMNQTPNVLHVEGFLADSDQIFSQLLDTVDWDQSMSSRQTASYGVPYNYSQMAYPARDFPILLKSIAIRLQARLKISFNNCLLNLYKSGRNTMSFHSDDVADLKPGTGVAVISLGGRRNISFRNIKDPSITHEIPLETGSLLYMDAAIQAEWMHAIKKTEESAPRISLTWRSFVEESQSRTS